MVTDEKINIDTSVDFILKLGQATILFSLLLFLIQYKWLEYFYTAIGAGWVVSHFTWDQILFTATPYGGIFLLAIFMFAIVPSRMTTKTRFVILAFCHIGAGVFAIIMKDAEMSIGFLFGVWALSGLYLLLGGLVVNSLVFKPEDGGSNNSPLVVVSVIAFIYLANMAVADKLSIYRLENSDQYYPQLSESDVFGSSDKLKLMGPVGDKFLLIDETAKGRQFRLVEDISKYRIHPIKRPFLLEYSILSI